MIFGMSFCSRCQVFPNSFCSEIVVCLYAVLQPSPTHFVVNKMVPTKLTTKCINMIKDAFWGFVEAENVLLQNGSTFLCIEHIFFQNALQGVFDGFCAGVSYQFVVKVSSRHSIL